MLDFKELKNKKLGVFCGAAFTVVWAVVSVIFMLSARSHGEYGYTGAIDYIIRLILIVGCSVLFIGATVFAALPCFTDMKSVKCVRLSIILCEIALLCAVAVAVISLLREFQNSKRLLEDVMYVVFILAILMAFFISSTFKIRKKMFIALLVAASLCALCIILDIIIFSGSTNRSIDFMYFAHRIAMLLPFVVVAIAAVTLLPEKFDASAESIDN